jgi:hypothetical protein
MGTFRRRIRDAVVGLWFASLPLLGQSLPKPGPLQPGEGLVLCLGDAAPQSFGEVGRRVPMGSLAVLPWLKLMGEDWASVGVRYRCTGGTEPFPCGGAKGHGTVDLESALRKGCDRAVFAWASASLAEWRTEVGAGAARLQLLDVFGPFLGDRLPPGQGLPVLSPAWVGRGDLLQTSPTALDQWLQDPLQMNVVAMLQRYGSGYFGEIKFLLDRDGWWTFPATAPVPGGGTSAWVVAGREGALVVLHLPSGRGEVEGLARLKAILGVH